MTTSNGRLPDPLSRPPRRRRSRAVRLTIIGSAGGLATLIGGCSSQPGTWHRNVYGSVEDCAADYTRTVCVTEGTQRPAAFSGPAYRMVGGRPAPCTSSDRGAGPTWNTRRISVEAVDRGGFGTSCPSRSRRWGSGGGSRGWSSGG